MEALSKQELLSIEDYVAREKTSEIRHEYVAGVLYAKAGASREHNTLSLNLASHLRSYLRGRPCQVFMADLKVRLEIAREDIFYYPDVVVACDSRDTDRFWIRYPKVLIEVLSPETERTDRREKFVSYTQIESLEEYVLVAQDRMEVTLFQRARQWRPEALRQAEDQMPLVSLGFSMSLKAIYEGVKV